MLFAVSPCDARFGQLDGWQKVTVRAPKKHISKN